MAMSSPRPRISRDTRWLLIVVVASVTALSQLARVRFGNADRITGPIAPVISQLQPRSPFDEMRDARGLTASTADRGDTGAAICSRCLPNTSTRHWIPKRLYVMFLGDRAATARAGDVGHDADGIPENMRSAG